MTCVKDAIQIFAFNNQFRFLSHILRRPEEELVRIIEHMLSSAPGSATVNLPVGTFDEHLTYGTSPLGEDSVNKSD